MKFQKRHLVLASLVLALAAAVYLNWQFSDSAPQSTSVSKELGAATYVNTSVSTSDQETAQVANQSNDYFATTLVERDKAIDKAIDTAQETLKLAESTEDAKTLAVEQLNKLEDIVVAQSAVESTLKAKSYSQCVCIITDNSCTVSLLKDDIDKNTPLIVKDAVTSSYDISFSDVTILEI